VEKSASEIKNTAKLTFVMAAAASQSGTYCVINRNPECKIWYERLGDLTSDVRVMFVMGLNMSHRSWQMQVQHFCNAKMQVLHFDNRGVHRSSAPPGPYTTELMAHDALILASDLGWATFHLVGVSMGGMIAQRMAAISPKRVLSLSLIATRPGGSVLGDLPTMSGIGAFLNLRYEKDQAKRMPKALKLLFPDAFLNQIDPADEQKRTFRAIIGEKFNVIHDEEPPTPPHGTEAQTRAAIGHVLSAAEALAIKSAAFPVLILHGEDDQLIKVVNARKLHEMIGGELKIYAGVGHGINVQEHVDVNTRIEAHIRKAHAAAVSSGASTASADAVTADEKESRAVASAGADDDPNAESARDVSSSDETAVE
jgi:pimeloyl-ACP methyl ester carboxylesterase